MIFFVYLFNTSPLPPIKKKIMFEIENDCIEKKTELKRKIVILTITEACNLKCTYCFETKKTKKVMSLDVAKDAIKYAFENSDDFDEIEFDLFGGEPTLHKDLIKKIVTWTYEQNFNKPYLFFWTQMEL